MNIELMKTLCQMTEKQLFNTMLKYLKNHYIKVDFTKEYIIAYGSLPIVLCGHLDTVFERPPQEIYYDQKKKVMWSPQGLGADDRAGIYAILQIIEAGYRPSVIFTTGEELGGTGSQAIVSREPNCPLENLKAIFQLDRCGEKDCVFYQCDNPDFEKYVESFGFETNWGTFTDISILAPQWGVAAANLSVGYWDEHSEIERLRIDWLEATIEKVKKILDDSDNMLSYTYIPKKLAQDFVWSSSSCLYCGKHISGKNKHHINGRDQYGSYSYYLCDQCYKREFEEEEDMIDKYKKI